ncbi:regulatory protein RecX [Halomonas sp. MCCC 1A17488]|uniref:Regulatory protein RecX n=1 Tax=Billgrantia sulfidoxydans TaxID=2733484 RepID=A0ABX7VZJ7_9GAMM|nr:MULTISPECIES: regulatory protein RecX [Halomonas]MCE8016687.1 regulatory protein RecX [Halomonas sp. MCCC 1A17488]MCG3240020.1 regulatory protein RecX [Halomonas sp. MCCC 1A17488]QPP50094.1 regulatory protein RecX [Halomonas sp. SS10-MC5]QTP53706.1 regulatory protein RecX [Halomonas sulfidoxydans]
MPARSEAPAASPRDDAIRLLARREYSRAELTQRLASRAHPTEAIDACLDALAEAGLQSDARFAESFLRSRVMRGQGPLKVRAELERRGVERGLIAAALAEAEREGEVDWFELAREVLERRFSGPGDTPRERARRERFLAARGFDFEQIRHALARLGAVD